MIKTRFAPSPTGYLHIGGLRTALYAYIFAVQNKGKFILRIEDTDQSREVTGAAEKLLETLTKMDLEWSEGPYLDKDLKIREKGSNGPYFQSQRLKIYQEYAQKLINEDKAYYCFCSQQKLSDLRLKQQENKEQPKYDQCCRKLTESEVKEKSKRGLPFVIRLKVPAGSQVVFNDLIRGEVKISTKEIDDQVLIKSDGFPTYHLANVVDDHLMEITHVIRGEEWLPSTPKHILLYQAFDWNLPQFAHLPLLLNKDRSKLSKRQGDVAVEDYLNKGYLVEALINYVALLGWHPQDDREIFNLKDLIKEFDLKRVQKAGAIFDPEKLNWFNSYYIRQKSAEELLELIKPEGEKEKNLKILALEKERLTTLNEFLEKAQFYFNLPSYDPQILIFKKSDLKTTKESLNKILKGLEYVEDRDWKADKIKNILTKTVEENNFSNGDVFWPARVAVSGLQKSPPPEEIMAILGREESLKRLSQSLNML